MAKNEKLRGKKLLDKELFLSTYEGRDKIVSSHELAEELKKTDDSIFQIPTGIKSMDRILGGGVEAGELIVVTGPTGEGKTTLLMTITSNMAIENINATWFTLEVTPRQFLKKLTKTEEGKDPNLPLFYIPNAGFEDVDDKYLSRFEKENNRKYEMMDWIEDRIIESKVKTEKEGRILKVVFIDHIHMIFSLAVASHNVSLEMGDMVAKIKEMAITHNLAIFLIAHSKDPKDPIKEPRKEDIRDSGLISRLADTIIGVWRIQNSDDGTGGKRKEIDEDDNKTKVRVFKNRREGKLGYFCMYHVDHYLTEDSFSGLSTPELKVAQKQSNLAFDAFAENKNDDKF